MILCSLADIEEGASKGFDLGEDRKMFAVKKDGEVSLFENRCPHLGIPLEMMPDQFLDIDKQFIQCSTHGALFQFKDGLCVAGPCNGASLKAIEFEIVDQEIHIAD